MRRTVVLLAFVPVFLLLAILATAHPAIINIIDDYPTMQALTSVTLYENKTSHEGDIVVSGNETFVIKDCEYTQTGNIFVENNATLIIQNATLQLNQTRHYEYEITLIDRATLKTENIILASQKATHINVWGNAKAIFIETTIGARVSERSMEIFSKDGSSVYMYGSFVWYLDVSDRSNVQVINSEIGTVVNLRFILDTNLTLKNLHIGLILYWNLYENSTVNEAYLNITIKNTTVGWRIGVYSLDSSNIGIQDLEDLVIACFGNSSVQINNSTVEVMETFDNSSVQILGSSILLGTRCKDNTVVQAANSEFQWGNVTCYNNASLQVIDSIVYDNVVCSDFSLVRLINTEVRGSIEVHSDAVVFVKWYLDVHVVDSEGSDAYYANVTVIYANGTVAGSEKADENGRIRFTLIEKMINVTGTYPIGNYTVAATYENYSGEQSVNMTNNKQITIVLPFIIPEFPATLIIFLLVIAVLAAAVIGRKFWNRTYTNKHP